MNPVVCIVDDEKEVCASLSELFHSEGIECAATTSPEEARAWLTSRNDFRLVITDVKMPGLNGLELLRAANRERPDLAVIVMTGYPSIENAVAAMRLGAANFIAKPVDFSSLLEETRRLLSSRRPPHPVEDEIVTANPHFLAVIQQLDKAAGTDVPVVLLGESGTGKELLARRLHRLSRRKNNAYLCVNCAALPETLLESELFGHEKGAFTGAARERRGRFELADNGTILLDEIGDMPLPIQAKILRAVEHGEFERVGGSSTVHGDVRFIAATNRNLRELVEQGRFRGDLYYRLAVVALNVPPLRERRDDVPLLLDHFVAVFNRQYGKSIAGVAPDAVALLAEHDWPGNVRELRNCVQRAVIFRDAGMIGPADLPEQYHARESALPAPSESRRDKLRRMDRDLIVRTLAECDGSRSLAAEKLRIHRKTLYNRMKSLGLGD